jgi:pyridoxal phosphate phosphatase PHOSPHO2
LEACLRVLIQIASTVQYVPGTVDHKVKQQARRAEAWVYLLPAVFYQTSIATRMLIASRLQLASSRVHSRHFSSTALSTPGRSPRRTPIMDSQNAGILAAAVLGLPGHLEASASVTDQRQRQQPSKPHTLFVWDFDWTVINCNSDEYVPAHFLGDEKTKKGFRELYNSGKGWHSCVEAMVNQAMEGAEASQQTVLEVAGQMPYLTGVRGALDAINNMAHGDGSTTGQMILSDGNTLFIGAFLDRNGLVEHFTHGVVSNKGFWQGNRLCVVHQSQQYGGHDCGMCQENLCKTQALQNTLLQWYPLPADENQREKVRPRIVYVGDGENDACPALKVLGEGDVMLARVGKKRKFANSRAGAETDEAAGQAPDGATEHGGSFGIASAIARAKRRDPPMVPKCQVLEWNTGEDLRQLVQKLLADVS